VLCLRGEPRLGAVMTDEEISWIQRPAERKVHSDRRSGSPASPGEPGQMPVLTAIMEFLAEPALHEWRPRHAAGAFENH